MCEGNKALSSPTSPRLSSPCSYTLSAACIAAETMGDPNEREPCPHRIIDDVGTAFSMGAIGGTFWHAFKGARSSPKGERLYGSVTGACSVCVFVAPLSLVTPPPLLQRSRATRGVSGAALPCGVAFFRRTTARSFILEKRRTLGTQSPRASAPAPLWRLAVVQCAPAIAPPLCLTPALQARGPRSLRVVSAAFFLL